MKPDPSLPDPPRKRLLSGGLNPPAPSAQCPAAAEKKTRDLPNLSECHACGFRIDLGNGKCRLQTLYSQWRVVLLCKKCIGRVRSSEICSYCFLDTSQDCFRCRECKHCVHKKCFLKYKSVAPWSYSSMGSEFSVCVDCWVPKSVGSSIRASERRIRNGKSIIDSESGNSGVLDNGVQGKSSCNSRVLVNMDQVKSNSRVLDDGVRVKLEGNSMVVDNRGLAKSNSRVLDDEVQGKLLENVVKDANCAVEEKIEVAARAREVALTKAVAAKRAMELASNALDLVSKRDWNGGKEGGKRTSCKVVDDAELAIQLHRAMNSSPRILKSLCSVNSSCLALPRTGDCNGQLSVTDLEPGSKSICGKLKLSANNNLEENPNKCASEPSVCVSASDHDPLIHTNCLQLDRMIDMGDSLKNGECNCKGKCDARDGNQEVPLKEEVGSCSDRLMNSNKDDNSIDSKTRSCEKHVKSTILKDERSNEQCDRYRIKYRKAKKLKSFPNCKLKYVYRRLHVKSQALAAGLMSNCTNESRAFSNASFQSCSVHLQSSACESRSSRDQP